VRKVKAVNESSDTTQAVVSGIVGRESKGSKIVNPLAARHHHDYHHCADVAGLCLVFALDDNGESLARSDFDWYSSLDKRFR
jgi:hypothetical protein